MVGKILHVGVPETAAVSEAEEEERRILLAQARDQLGRWDAPFALKLMEAAGARDAEVRVEETTRELRQVRKHAIDLRAAVDRCVETLEALMTTMETTASLSSQRTPSKIQMARSSFLSSLSLLLSGTFCDLGRNDMPSLQLLREAGIDVSDHYGWLTAFGSERFHSLSSPSNGHEDGSSSDIGGQFKCGQKATEYFKAREDGIATLLTNIQDSLEQYERRVQGIESFVFMQCVGIQLEKHFSSQRANSLAEWEKKTDLHQAIAMANKKRLPKLVKELEGKLESLDSNTVPISRTYVKQAKERHLASKTLKSELQDLAARRFERSKECAVKEVVELIRLWAERE
jgi:predicted DNA-binding protein